MRTFERDFVYVGYLSILIKLEVKIEKSLKYKDIQASYPVNCQSDGVFCTLCNLWKIPLCTQEIENERAMNILVLYKKSFDL